MPALQTGLATILPSIPRRPLWLPPPGLVLEGHVFRWHAPPLWPALAHHRRGSLYAHFATLIILMISVAFLALAQRPLGSLRCAPHYNLTARTTRGARQDSIPYHTPHVHRSRSWHHSHDCLAAWWQATWSGITLQPMTGQSTLY